MAAIVEGLPAGLHIDVAAIDRDLLRRQRGYGRGQRSRSIERDAVVLTGGVRFEETIGAPVLLEIANLDHAKWTGVMDAGPVDDRSAAEAKKLVRPRPGHADLAGALKYGRTDMRDVLERASARNTNVRVAAGCIAKGLLGKIGIEVFSIVTKIGGVEYSLPEHPGELARLRDAAEASDVGCPDADVAERMRARIDEARKAGDTVGGSFAVVATNVPAGLGSYAEWDRRLDGRLAQAVMSIQAVKAVELGLGTKAGDVLGSEAHDAIEFDASARGNGAGGFTRPTNRAGGVEGGITNGQPIVVRGTMKPISTLAKPLHSVEFHSKESAPAAYERSDTAAVLACAVIAEAAVAWTLADAALEAFGGDTLEDFVRAHATRVGRYAAV
ncbi:chorismate synthase [Myxococcota bacterium]|nr:chorismate synthase [Myxococcota bacterium]